MLSGFRQYFNYITLTEFLSLYFSGLDAESILSGAPFGNYGVVLDLRNTDICPSASHYIHVFGFFDNNSASVSLWDFEKASSI